MQSSWVSITEGSRHPDIEQPDLNALYGKKSSPAQGSGLDFEFVSLSHFSSLADQELRGFWCCGWRLAEFSLCCGVAVTFRAWLVLATWRSQVVKWWSGSSGRQCCGLRLFTFCCYPSIDACLLWTLNLFWADWLHCGSLSICLHGYGFVYAILLFCSSKLVVVLVLGSVLVGLRALLHRMFSAVNGGYATFSYICCGGCCGSEVDALWLCCCQGLTGQCRVLAVELLALVVLALIKVVLHRRLLI